MLVKRSQGREWVPTDHPGVERALFRYNESGGRSSFVRLKKGAKVPAHIHEGTEEVVVISGTVRLGEAELSEGDYLFTSPGEQHDVVAVTDTVIFVSSQKPTPMIAGGTQPAG
mgnify:CR=1 FL=1